MSSTSLTRQQIAQANADLTAFEGICDDCGEPCSPVVIDNSFSHEFGVEHRYDHGSPCCEANVVEGGAKLIERKIHIARKEHGQGIMPGDQYQRTVMFHWRTDGPGWFVVSKNKLSQTVAARV